MKRTLITLSFIALTIANVMAQSSFTLDGLTYTITDAENHYVSVSKSSTTLSGELEIPSQINYPEVTGITYTVTSVPANAFIGCTELTSIIVPNTVTNIGEGAFSGCSGLTSITLPFVGQKVYTESDTYQYPFGYVFGTSSYTGGTATTQYYNPYNDRTGYERSTYYIPTDLKEVIITGGNKLPFSAFCYCTGISSVTIPNTVTAIDNLEFQGCSGLTSVTIPNSVTVISNCAFISCTSLASITIPNSVTTIGSGAFYECSELTSIDIPNSVITIGSEAFSSCNKLRYVTIPKSVTTIELNAFTTSATFCCEHLKKPDGWFYSYNYWWNNNRGTIYWGTSFIVGDFGYLIADDNKVSVSYYLGDDLEVSIPSKVTYNGVEYCVTGICDKVFKDKQITSISIPDSVENIGNEAFSGCSGLTAITIPNFVNTIGNSAFEGCTKLAKAEFASIKSLCEIDFKGNTYYANPLYYAHNLYVKGEEVTKIDIPEGVTTINQYAFVGCNKITTVTIPNTVTTIEGSPFAYCDKLMKATLKAAAPPIVNAQIFSSDVVVNVPCGSKSSYQSANYWNAMNYTEINVSKLDVSSADLQKGTVEILRLPTCEQSAVIMAYANEGYVFTNWSDENTANPRYLTVTQDTALVAYFVISEIEAEIVSANTVQGTVSNSSGTYHYNDEIEISATANYGYHFARWSDGVTTNQRTVVLSKDTVIEAEFAANQYTITLQTNNSELGSVAGGGAFNYLSSNEISATANEGYVFAKWEDGNTSNPRTVSLTCDTTFMAVFVPAECQLQVATSDEEKGSVSDSSGTYHYKDEVEISATANYGYHFSQWSDGVTKNPRTIQLIKDTVIEAQFAVNQYSIQLQSNDTNMGSANGAGSFDYLSTNKISATPKTGFVFHHWSDENTDNPRTITLTRDTAFTAVFVPDEVNVEVKSADTEHGTVTELSGVYHFNEKIIISAIAVPHYHFVSWSDGNRQNPREVLLRGDTVLTAAFGIDTFSVAAKCDTAMGAVSGAGLYSYGSAAKVEAKPAAHHHFVQWTNGAVQSMQEFVVEHDTAFEAVFAIDRHSVALAASDSLCGAVSGAGSYDYGASVQLQATPAANCYFTGWSDGVTTNPRTLTVEGDTNIVAEFGKLQTVNIIVAANDSLRGTVAGTGSYVVGSNATLSATASAHYLFEQWSDGRTDNPRTVRAIADATYTAVFVPMQYNIILSQNNADMGMVSGSGVYSYGERVSCLAKPYPNYHFVQWSNGETANPYEFVVEEDKMLTAYFAVGAVTAIGNESATQPTIYAIGKTIVVENATDEICVYDAMGKLICRDAIHRVRAELRVNAAGVYIVKTGNVVMRVVVE